VSPRTCCGGLLSSDGSGRAESSAHAAHLRLHRSRRWRGCCARRPVARLDSRSVGSPRPAGLLPHCEDPTVRAGAVTRRPIRKPRAAKGGDRRLPPRPRSGRLTAYRPSRSQTALRAQLTAARPERSRSQESRTRRSVGCQQFSALSVGPWRNVSRDCKNVRCARDSWAGGEFGAGSLRIADELVPTIVPIQWLVKRGGDCGSLCRDEVARRRRQSLDVSAGAGSARLPALALWETG